MVATPRWRARCLAPLTLLIAALAFAPSGVFLPSPVSADTDLTLGGEARISYANGDDVRLRDEPSYNGSILTTVPEGWLVAVHDGPIDDGAGSYWYEVTARGQRGYIVSDFLADAGSSSAAESSDNEVTAAAVATTTVNLRLRASASTTAAILLVIPSGATVNTTGVTQNGFSQLSYQGTTGWASSQYISSGGGAVISNAWVIGGALNLRSSPSTSSGVILVMPNNAQVGVLGAAQNGFTPVRYNGSDGWAYSQFLSSTNPGSGATATATSGTVISNAWVVGGALNLRSGPGTSSSVLLVMPNGAQVGVTGNAQNGFLPVRYNGTNGWASSQYLTSTQPGATATATSGSVISNAWVSATGGLNLRSGPATTNSVLLVIPNGSQVGVTGSAQNSFTPVRYNGTNGWASSQFLTTSQPGATATATAGSVIETRYATAGLNMRSGAGTTFSVILLIPSGAAVGITGSQTNGFFPVRYNNTNGFASATYLSTTPPGSAPSPTQGTGNTGSGIVWPVDGSTWEITQGYNGSSHVNSGSLSQYLYSLDIARQDRSTANQAVYAPVSGTVRWTERASGGITIDMGNGYAVAMFHVTVDRGWEAGDTISQGQYVGYISPPGGEGFVQFSHLHLTVWATTDGGNWSRTAVPFTGQNTISGQSFPDIGGTQQWTGTLFNP